MPPRLVPHRAVIAVALAFALVAPGTAPLPAQSIAVQVGDSARLTVAPGARVGIPLRVDLSAAGTTLNLASLQGTLAWGTTRLTFDSVRVNPATDFTQTVNTTGTATGTLVLSYFGSSRLAASAALATAWFTASATAGGTRVTFAPSAAGNEAGNSILAQVVPRALDLCVANSARWGDVNDDGTVSIIDAQQIARSSVGLTVGNAAAVAARGDVNADGSVSIIDAQQIARFSVGLTAAARINTALAAVPTASSLALSSATAAVAVGSTVTLTATPRDSANTDISGCAPVTWSSSAPAVATVSAGGVVTGVSAGSATITATSGTRTATAAITVTPAGLNYRIANAYVVQAVQAADRSTGLVAGRGGLLRVFVTASQANTATPPVRVTLYHGTTVVRTVTVTAPEASVRTAIAPELLTSTWNVALTDAEVASGLRILAELDPNSTLGEADRGDNSWPANGTPQAFTVTTVPTLTVRWVPVTIGTNTGNVTAANAASYIGQSQRLFPIPTVSASVRASFTTSVTTLAGEDMDKWSTILSEVNALRATDGAPAATYYHGILKATYTSGIAGLAYTPGRTGVSWDDPGTSPGVVAHELGHNFGREHAPCDVTGDVAYPYAGGVIGQFGYNAATNAVVLPTATDIMGYCSNQWVSDYTWNAVLQHRVANPLQALVASAKGAGLLVWGRIVDGQVVLEPAFPVDAPPSPPSAGGSLRVELRDAAGTVLTALPVEPLALDHSADRHFAVVVPLGAVSASAVAAIRVQDVRLPTRAAQRVVARDAAGAPLVAGAAFDAGARVAVEPERVRVQWAAPAGASVMAMVRDAASGEIRGFVRRSGDAVRTDGRRMEVVYSDGVQARVKRVF